MTALTFEVNLPPQACSPNSRGHWRKKNPGKADYRDGVAWLAVAARQSAGIEPFALDPGRVSLLFGTKGARGRGVYCPQDNDNALASFKAGIDGMVLGGIFRNDSSAHVTLGDIRIDRTAGPWVRVTVESIEALR